MVTDLPADLRNDVGRATDVVTAFVGDLNDETNTQGDTADLMGAAGDDMPNTIVFGTDVEVLAAKVKTLYWGEEGNQTLEQDMTAASAAVAAATVQWSTRGTYTAVGGDGEVPAGVIHHETFYAGTGLGYEDETNGTGGMGGTFGEIRETMLSQEQLEVTSTVEFDEGTELGAHNQVEAVPDGAIQLESQIWLWFRER